MEPEGGAPAYLLIEKMNTHADIFDIALEELAVWRLPVEVLDEKVKLKLSELRAFHLEAAANGKVEITLLAILNIDGNQRTHQAIKKRRSALQLQT